MSVDLGPLEPILDGADQVYVAVRTGRGPHLTPELFALSGDRLVCMTGAGTLKATRLQRDPVAGIAARSDAGSFAAVARVEVLDPARPTTALRSPLAAATSPLDVARFVRDNAAELSGAAIDALSGRLGVPPQRRVALVCTLEAAVAVDRSGETWADGWSELGAPLGERNEDGAGDRPVEATPEDELPLDELPGDLRELVTTAEVVLGWSRSDGTPLALPARWDDGSAFVPRALFEATAATISSPASVTFDGWSGFGPTGKQGVMLRGTGRATTDGDDVRVDLDVDRATHWDGIETGTVERDR